MRRSLNRKEGDVTPAFECDLSCVDTNYALNFYFLKNVDDRIFTRGKDGRNYFGYQC